MTSTQSKIAKRRYDQTSTVICPMCGQGRILTADAQTRSKKGGQRSYQKSLEPGQLSMGDRGRMGGRPRARTLEDVLAKRKGERGSQVITSSKHG